ncbi:hypothetical protein, partial [Escherichia coli]|uniref:hypothetical protein n=1 Tax=Escherichia coli TaxID=562 RepID=UPI00215B137E
TQFRPNLAGKLNFEALDFDRFEYIADYKYDGVRAMVIDGQLVSRSLKPIPNKFTQALFGRSILNGLDGELLVGTPNSPTVFRDSMSGVMTA